MGKKNSSMSEGVVRIKPPVYIVEDKKGNKAVVEAWTSIQALNIGRQALINELEYNYDTHLSVYEEKKDGK